MLTFWAMESVCDRASLSFSIPWIILWESHSLAWYDRLQTVCPPVSISPSFLVLPFQMCTWHSRFPCSGGDHVNTSWPMRCWGGGVRMPLRLCPQREGDTRPLPSWNMEEVVSCRGLWEEATSGGWWYNQRVSAWFFHDLSEQGDCSLLRCCVRDINFHVVQATAIWPPRFSSQTCTLSDAPGTHSSLHSGPRPSFLHWFLRKCHMPDHWAEQNCFLYPEYLYFFQFSIHSLSFGKHPPLSSHVAQGQECDLGLADQPILPLTTCPGQLV